MGLPKKLGVAFIFPSFLRRFCEMFIPNKWKISCGLRADFSVMGWVQLASGPEKCGAAVEAGWGDHGEPQYSILC